MLVVMLSMSGCIALGAESMKSEKDREKSVELYVSAAASLTESMADIERAYELAYPEVELIVNLASSGSLQRQIEEGAPVDVFISASMDKMVTLQEEGLLYEDTYEALLGNEIVLIAPFGSEKSISFEMLTSADVEIFAIGEPESVPAGKYAKEALVSLGLYEDLEDRIILAKDVKEVLTWVEMNEADAGMVYQTDAFVSEEVQIVEGAPEGSHKPIVYPVAVVGDSNHVEEAKAFIAYLKDAGMDIFTSYGFNDGTE